MAASREAGVGLVAASRYWRAADARVVVEAWKRSEETLPEFARRHGISAKRLRRWARELEAQDAGEADGAVLFHPVRLVQPERVEDRRAGQIEIVLREGSTVRVPAGFASEDLERVLAVLGVGL
jgi:hypothetical protein